MSKWAEPSVSGLNERDVDVAMEKREHVLAGSDERMMREEDGACE
jgi:hypothetical protein